MNEVNVEDQEVQVNEDEDLLEEEIGTAIEDIENDEEELWPSGPKIGQCKDWKKQYGKLYVTSIDPDTHIVWRPINRLEYKNIVRKMEQLSASGQISQAAATMQNEEALASVAMLYPKLDLANPQNELAGVASLISKEVMDASGFVAMSVKEL